MFHKLNALPQQVRIIMLNYTILISNRPQFTLHFIICQQQKVNKIILTLYQNIREQMTTKNLKQMKQIQLSHFQEDPKFIYRRIGTQKMNLFQIQEQKKYQRPNPRQLMIQKLKNQTQELKEMKKAISSVSVSRLNQMKKIINQNLHLESQNQYLFDRNTDSQNDNYKFTKSIKDLVRMRLSDPIENKELKSGEKIKTIDQNNVNPESTIPNNCQIKPQQTNLIQSENLYQNLHSLESHEQTPSLITNNNQIKNIRFGHTRKISTEINSLDKNQTQNKSFLKKANSQRRLRSSTSQFSRSRKNNQMTLSVRKQLHQMQSKQKILKNKIKLIQSQTQHKLDKKIKENTQLLQKHKGLYDIIQTRMERQRQKSNLTRKKLQQRRFIHQGKALKVNIQRLSKQKQQQEQKEMIRNQSQQSLLNLAYSRFLKQKEDLSKQQKLAFRMSFAKDFQSKDLVRSRITYSNNSASRARSISSQFV